MRAAAEEKTIWGSPEVVEEYKHSFAMEVKSTDDCYNFCSREVSAVRLAVAWSHTTIHYVYIP